VKPASKGLALRGGPPVRRERLPYARPEILDEDVAAVVEVLRSGWLTTGPQVEAFEEAFAERMGARFAVALSSGTTALEAALFACGLGPGDEVVTSPLTFCATANAALRHGARPVFADVCDDTLCLDPDAAAAAIGVRTRVLLPVDYAGHPADLDAFAALARRAGLALVEDACHATGARLGGRPVGSRADIAVYSLHPVKHLAAGEGGVATTDDPELARRLRLYRSHGIDSDPRRRAERGDWRYEMVALGVNGRLSDVACALAQSQLRRLDRNLARRRALAATYDRALRDLPGIRLPVVRDGAEPAWHLYPIRVIAEVLGADRDLVHDALRAEGIGTNVHYLPVHLHPYYRDRFGLREGLCPVAEGAFRELLSLPLFHGMGDADAEDVVAALRKVVRELGGS